MKPSNVPYDSVFRTLLNDCTSLIIPVINEVFSEHYSGKEQIQFYPNEHFLNRQGGKEQERITDTCFMIYGGETPKKYHLECQSTADDSMLVRFFEYDAQIALDNGTLSGNALEVEFPHSAVLFLRCREDTPDRMQLNIRTPGGSLSYGIPAMKTQEYTLSEIFEKNLLFLIPFYIFSHERHFQEYAENREKLAALRKEYAGIRERLEELCIQRKISDYMKCTILDMSGKVLEHIAKKYEAVKEGVKDIMVGTVLDYEAKRIRNEGVEEGIREGIREGEMKIYAKMIQSGRATVQEAAFDLNISEREMRNFMETNPPGKNKEARTEEEAPAKKAVPRQHRGR